MQRSFYVVVHGRGNQWEAICLDLDLAAHAHSLSEVQKLMGEIIETYVQDAMNEREPARSALLNRGAPLWVRAYWATRIALAALRSGRARDDADIPVGYPVPCHA